MGRGRAPCCDKSKVKRGPWSPCEDLKLISFIRQHGHDNWRALPKLAGLSRCGKSCRLRWINYLRPDVKRGNFTKEEEETIVRLHQSLGNKWSKIASHLPGRTDNEIKNVWNTHLKKKLSAFDTAADSNREESKRESSLTSSSSSYSSPSPFTAARRDGDGDGDVDAIEIDTGNKEAENDMMDRAGLRNKSSSSHSHGSDLSNISGEFGGTVKDGEEKVDPFSISMEEVDKPDAATGSDMLEIPFEFDMDFWNMLDNLGTFPLHAVEIDRLLEVDGYRVAQLGDQEIDRDIENEKWLRYLENELGLVEPPAGEDDSKHPKDASQPLD